MCRDASITSQPGQAIYLDSTGDPEGQAVECVCELDYDVTGTTFIHYRYTTRTLTLHRPVVCFLLAQPCMHYCTWTHNYFTPSRNIFPLNLYRVLSWVTYYSIVYFFLKQGHSVNSQFCLSKPFYSKYSTASQLKKCKQYTCS